jgi:hypothetical protein
MRIGETHRGNIASSALLLYTGSSTHEIHTICPSIVPSLIIVPVVGVNGRRGLHPVIESRKTIMSRSIVICSVKALQLPSTMVIEMSRWLAIQLTVSTIAPSGTWRLVWVVHLVSIIVLGVPIRILLCHLDLEWDSKLQGETRSLKFGCESKVCKEPCSGTSLNWLLRTRGVRAAGANCRSLQQTLREALVVVGRQLCEAVSPAGSGDSRVGSSRYLGNLFSFTPPPD